MTGLAWPHYSFLEALPQEQFPSSRKKVDHCPGVCIVGKGALNCKVTNVAQLLCSFIMLYLLTNPNSSLLPWVIFFLFFPVPWNVHVLYVCVCVCVCLRTYSTCSCHSLILCPVCISPPFGRSPHPSILSLRKARAIWGLQGSFHPLLLLLLLPGRPGPGGLPALPPCPLTRGPSPFIQWPPWPPLRPVCKPAYSSRYITQRWHAYF